MSNTESPRDPVDELAPTEDRLPLADHSGPSGLPSPDVIARGYEADVYDAKSVLSVPLLVVLFFVLAFGTVTILFWAIAYPARDPMAHPGAAKRNDAPLPDRLQRIDVGSKDVKQPRLEPLTVRSGDARAITRPEVPGVNPPLIHPENLRPTKERYPSLFGHGPNRLGLDQAMSLGEKELASLFPVRKDGTAPPDSRHVPTAANAGQGFGDSRAILPQVPEVPVAKKEEKKDNKDENKDEKKDENKDGKEAPQPKPKEGGQ